jgi:hypothetical protein
LLKKTSYSDTNQLTKKKKKKKKNSADGRPKRL